MHHVLKIVIDTNVLVAALRSRAGWSFELLTQLDQGRYQPVVTVPLVMEYEDVLLRPGMVPVAPAAVTDILDYLCAMAVRQTVHFLWRPRLADVKDDMVLEAAVNGQCQCIVTWNLRDFAAASSLGIKVMTPQTFLNLNDLNQPERKQP
ncbi:putative toxin-antitoxin system toxin component, PIN family [Sphaerotilus sp.]|uniref:putative toxin-antitoxin system toxin component, PIN family n=1 Tax=Sphaerotilus sp. TaxID=2093942 RepID=UPI002ACE1491|nr:putative toxin-antitoxin system toxin component, PIN family [Sphaerotilus sp.]MDZ7856289.1 putative toxin-antitoxin system toxin component, PIN family [Sphaerotilus sp.]